MHKMCSAAAHLHLYRELNLTKQRCWLAALHPDDWTFVRF